MLKLSKISQIQNIGTYNFKVNQKSIAQNSVTQTDSEKPSQHQSNIHSFKMQLDNASSVPKSISGTNNAAPTPEKKSQSDYTDAEWDAQRKKNIAISKLQQTDSDIAALERVAPGASEEVKKAWVDASRKTGYNGLGYNNDISQNSATRLYAEMTASTKMTDNSAAGVQDILGGTVQSAIDAVLSAKHDLTLSENSSDLNSNKELAFYDAFLDKLNGLQDGTYVPSDISIFDQMHKSNIDVLPNGSDDSQMQPELLVSTGNAANETEIPEGYLGSAFFHRTTSSDVNGISFDLYAKYPEGYDPQNPKVEVYTNYLGEEKLYEVSINDVNPETATQTELYGLFAYIEDDKNIPRNIDPASSDLYYSALDRKLEILHQSSSAQDDTDSDQETYIAGNINAFRPMDNLSYWDKKELLESIHTEG
ncbi:hypothetical protein [Butyrivibrio sp. JL13D10]|uniref:hypothetical protein n=1 Tax=Butyrivibrio sp. JL13D10 TaxID=3236815 RepID=UPI0038B65320